MESDKIFVLCVSKGNDWTESLQNWCRGARGAPQPSRDRTAPPAALHPLPQGWVALRVATLTKTLFSSGVRILPLGSIQTVKINCGRCILSPFLTFLVVFGKKQDLGCHSLRAGHPMEGAADIATLWSCLGQPPLHHRTPKKNPKKLPLIRGDFFGGSGTVRPTGLAPVSIERGDQIESTTQNSRP